MGTKNFTSELLAIVNKIGGVLAGVPKEAGDAGEILTSLVTDYAAARADIGTGNVFQVISDAKSDYAALKAEFEQFKTDLVASVHTTATAAATTAVATAVAAAKSAQ